MKSSGALQLGRTGATQDAIAQIAIVSREAVHYWLSGEKKPSKAKRDVLFRTYGISVNAWEEYTESPTVEPSETELVAEPTPLTTSELANRIRSQASRVMVQIETEKNTTPLERARLLERLAGIVDRLSKSSGATAAAKLAKSSQWIDLRTKLVEAIRRFPDAREAIMRAIETVEDDDGGDDEGA